MKRLLLFLIFPLAVLAQQQQPQPAPDISISANGTTDLNLYQGWPLIVDITIMNSLRFQGGSAPSLVVAPQTGNWTDAIQLTAISSSGNTFQWPFKLVGLPSDPTLTLGPNSYVSATWQISLSDTSALLPDTYQLITTFQVTSTIGWSGTVAASPATIQVSPEPTLTSDQLQLKTLLISQYQTNIGDLDAALTTVQQYLSSNPNDPLALTAAANLLELQGYPGLAYPEALSAVSAFNQADPPPMEAPWNLLTMNQRLFTFMTTANSSTQPTDTTATNTQVGYSSADQSVTLTATVTSPTSSVNEGTVAFTVTGVGNSVSATALQGTATASYTIPGGTAVGNYVLQESYSGTSNFQSSNGSGQLTITPTALSITANNASRQYGQPNAAFTASHSGFVNGDTGSTLQGTLACTTTATQSSSVGSYPITCSGLSSPNYTIVFVPGTLTITPAPLTVTANSASRQYGQANSVFTTSYTGFLNGDTGSTLQGTLVCTTSATQASPVGSYAITCSGLSSPNYTISFTPGALAIIPAPLTATANNASRQYGQANPPFTAAYSGFVNADTTSVLSGTLSCASAATPSSPVNGSLYLINCSGQTSNNYSITYVPGRLTITPAPLTITANNATKILNATLPAFSAIYSGFINGENSSVLSGVLSCTTSATASSPVGSYAITCSGQSSSNYALSHVPGTLKIIYQPGGICDGDAGHQILSPINPNGGSVWIQGRTVPAKFRVCDANGVSIGAPGVVASFYLTQIVASAAATVDEVVRSTTPDAAFRWDSTNQLWIFNISTANLTAGNTYIYTITLNDGSTITFQYGLR